ncbi:putative chitinase [Nitrobacteraceae bacterium AZCC 1564]
MTLKSTPESMRQLFPNAPQQMLDAFVNKQDALTRAGIDHTQDRLAFFFVANIEHECGGFTIRNLRENINYTAERMAAVWPKRFGSAASMRAKYGTAPGWHTKSLAISEDNDDAGTSKDASQLFTGFHRNGEKCD